MWSCLTLIKRMTVYKGVPVEVAKQIAGSYGKDMVVILCYDHASNRTHTTTYGIAPVDKVSAANAGEICTQALGGDLRRSINYEDFRKDLDAGKQRAMEEAIKKHLPALQKMALFSRMVADFRKALGE